ncbi:HAD-IIIA family hydrolase [Streptomyces glaucescens]|uniref:D-glycero-alpha-D-manno-heptose-1,7-bisphosphate 7-phosphatase n=1 Tax=Streptomyces glaucescens TaxID=1907 RepID=UPI003F57F17D
MTTPPWIFTGALAPARDPARAPGDGLPAAVLFDRDGTLVADVPYNGDPARVRPMRTARAAVDAVRSRGIAVGVVSNQSGVARGLLTRARVEAVQRRVEELLGPFAVWAVCPHGPDDGCACRKPAPGLVLAACARLGVDPSRSVVIGDIGADVAAARAAGARGVLVPTPVTRPEETAGAAETAPDLLAAVRLVLGPDPGPDPRWPGSGPERPAAGPETERPGPGAERGWAGLERPEAERRTRRTDSERRGGRPEAERPQAGPDPRRPGSAWAEADRRGRGPSEERGTRGPDEERRTHGPDGSVTAVRTAAAP